MDFVILCFVQIGSEFTISALVPKYLLFGLSICLIKLTIVFSEWGNCIVLSLKLHNVNISNIYLCLVHAKYVISWRSV